MLITKEVEIKLTNRNVTTYKNLGYICKSGDTIKIKTEHLSKRSDVRVDVLCDYCLEQGVETVVNKKYADYLVSREVVEKDSCKNHSSKKLDEVMSAKYGENYKKRETSNTFKVQWEEVVDLFKEREYILLSKEEEYKGTYTKLKYICPKHSDLGELEITYSKLKMGRGCKHCGIEKIRQKKRIPYSKVKSKFDKKGFVLLLTEEEYNLNQHINHKTPLPYKCKKHMEKGVMYTNHLTLSQTKGCFWCSHPKGESHYMWRGGATEIHLFLRNKLTKWKKDSMRDCGFKCVITGDSFDVIHHLYGFENIFYETFEETGIDIRESVMLYSEDELRILEDKCLEIHNRHPLGVCLKFEIHTLFHKLYGNGENTPEQWDDFVIRYKNGEFREIA